MDVQWVKHEQDVIEAMRTGWMSWLLCLFSLFFHVFGASQMFSDQSIPMLLNITQRFGFEMSNNKLFCVARRYLQTVVEFIKWALVSYYVGHTPDTVFWYENQINHGVKSGSQSAWSRCGVIYCALSTLFIIITVSREIISNVIFVTIMNQSHPDCSEIHKAWSQQR